jgi:hypothetical protein
MRRAFPRSPRGCARVCRRDRGWRGLCDRRVESRTTRYRARIVRITSAADLGPYCAPHALGFRALAVAGLVGPDPHEQFARRQWRRDLAGRAHATGGPLARVAGTAPRGLH